MLRGFSFSRTTNQAQELPEYLELASASAVGWREQDGVEVVGSKALAADSALTEGAGNNRLPVEAIFCRMLSGYQSVFLKIVRTP